MSAWIENYREEYAAKLKHPLWQKKRLEIMNRAGFKCECCGDNDKTLHVHHFTYKSGKEPWDYPDDNFECLCENCHRFREDFNKEKWAGRSKIPTVQCLGIWFLLEPVFTGELEVKDPHSMFDVLRAALNHRYGKEGTRDWRISWIPKKEPLPP